MSASGQERQRRLFPAGSSEGAAQRKLWRGARAPPHAGWCRRTGPPWPRRTIGFTVHLHPTRPARPPRRCTPARMWAWAATTPSSPSSTAWLCLTRTPAAPPCRSSPLSSSRWVPAASAVPMDGWNAGSGQRRCSVLTRLPEHAAARTRSPLLLETLARSLGCACRPSWMRFGPPPSRLRRCPRASS